MRERRVRESKRESKSKGCLSSLWMLLSKSVAVDVRGVHAMRVCLSLLVLIDLLARAPHIRMYQTDEGMFGKRERSEEDWPLALHVIWRSYYSHIVLNGMLACAAVSLMIGDSPRISAIITWILWTSMISIDENLLQGGDHILAGGLFFLILLPHEDNYEESTNYFKRVSQTQHLYAKKTVRVLKDFASTMGQMAFLVWLSSIYWGSVYGRKESPEWHQVGSAVSNILHDDNLAKPLGKILRKSPWICKNMTHMSMFVEWFAPFLLFLPLVSNGIFRLIGVSLLMGLHVGLGLSISLGFFQSVCFCLLLPFVPAQAYDKASKILNWLSHRFPALQFWLRILSILSRKSAKNEKLYPEYNDSLALSSIMKILNIKMLFSHKQKQKYRRMISKFRRSLGSGCHCIEILSAAVRVFLACIIIGLVARFEIVGSQTKRWLNLRTEYGFYPHADRMITGWWIVPGELRDGKTIDLYAQDYGDIHRTAALAFDAPVPNLDKSVILSRPDRRFASRHLRGATVSWTGLEGDKTNAYRYLRYICNVWNSQIGRTRKEESTDLVTVSLQVVASLGLSDKNDDGKTEWRMLMKNHHIEIARYQCLHKDGRKPGRIVTPSQFDAIVSKGIAELSARAEAIADTSNSMAG
mmetsp:Transcript_8977/g.13431  ORF Transcript_8977/g.13431 Transcript_8977/m.13431 type:complete len:638 (+) Transcript_8977:75-1988(+)